MSELRLKDNTKEKYPCSHQAYSATAQSNSSPTGHIPFSIPPVDRDRIDNKWI